MNKFIIRFSILLIIVLGCDISVETDDNLSSRTLRNNDFHISMLLPNESRINPFGYTGEDYSIDFDFKNEDDSIFVYGGKSEILTIDTLLKKLRGPFDGNLTGVTILDSSSNKFEYSGVWRHNNIDFYTRKYFEIGFGRVHYIDFRANILFVNENLALIEKIFSSITILPL